MLDIAGNTVEVGDEVYVVTSPHSGSNSKRLFRGEVLSTSKGGGVSTVKCFENGRVVRVTYATTVLPYQEPFDVETMPFCP